MSLADWHRCHRDGEALTEESLMRRDSPSTNSTPLSRLNPDETKLTTLEEKRNCTTMMQSQPGKVNLLFIKDSALFTTEKAVLGSSNQGTARR